MFDRLWPKRPGAFVYETLKQRTRSFAGVQPLQGEGPELRFQSRTSAGKELGCFGLVLLRFLKFGLQAIPGWSREPTGNSARCLRRTRSVTLR